mmetsp:Transcript_7480/g.19178  ORF Transcript_7480/g.19178 Transcript_7480/m.19178 type:complete len:220 (-) Transcript_7480:521-1180(-)
MRLAISGAMESWRSLGSAAAFSGAMGTVLSVTSRRRPEACSSSAAPELSRQCEAYADTSLAPALSTASTADTVVRPVSIRSSTISTDLPSTLPTRSTLRGVPGGLLGGGGVRMMVARSIWYPTRFTSSLRNCLALARHEACGATTTRSPSPNPRLLSSSLSTRSSMMASDELICSIGARSKKPSAMPCPTGYMSTATTRCAPATSIMCATSFAARLERA